jgi:rhodanese-related sulfurtransferase
MRRNILRTLLLVMAAIATAVVLPAEDVKKLSADDLRQYLKEGKYFFLDVREPSELEQYGSVKGYVNIPLGQVEKRMSEIPKDQTIVTMCEHGRRATQAAEILIKNGYKVVGACGLEEYRNKGYESVKVPAKK